MNRYGFLIYSMISLYVMNISIITQLISIIAIIFNFYISTHSIIKPSIIKQLSIRLYVGYLVTNFHLCN
jgi:hypothetical protein